MCKKVNAFKLSIGQTDGSFPVTSTFCKLNLCGYILKSEFVPFPEYKKKKSGQKLSTIDRFSTIQSCTIYRVDCSRSNYPRYQVNQESRRFNFYYFWEKNLICFIREICTFDQNGKKTHSNSEDFQECTLILLSSTNPNFVQTLLLKIKLLCIYNTTY